MHTKRSGKVAWADPPAVISLGCCILCTLCIFPCLLAFFPVFQEGMTTGTVTLLFTVCAQYIERCEQALYLKMSIMAITGFERSMRKASYPERKLQS
jgi:hypothetical protein